MKSHEFNHSFLKNNQYGYSQLFVYTHEDNPEKIGKGFRQYVAWDSPENDFEILLQSAFYDKTSYLEWVREWKDCYRFLTQEIRHAKRNRKQNSKDTQFDVTEWQYRASKGGEIARQMLVLRQVAKQMSWKIRDAIQEEQREVEHVI